MSNEKDKISKIKTLIQEKIDILEDEHRRAIIEAKGNLSNAETLYSEVLLSKIESLQEMYNEVVLIENE